MKILSDGQIFDGQQFGGISRYHLELTRALNKIDRCCAKIISPLHANMHLLNECSRRFSLGEINGLFFPYKKRGYRLRKYINSTVTNFALSTLKPDVYHKTYYDGIWPATRKAYLRVITIHDLIYELFGAELDQANELKDKRKNDLDKCDLVICVSESTKRDLMQIYNVDEKKLAVIYHGIDSLRSVFNTNNQNVDNLINKPYILYVGKRGGYKNFICLAKAWAYDEYLSKNYRLVCFGGERFDNDFLNEMRSLKMPIDRISNIKGNDELLAQLYRKAELFVYPSLYEGFGIPLLEAMQYSCPIVCSDISSIPEVVGKAGLLFEPESSEDLRAKIRKLTEDTSLREKLVYEGHQRVQDFSWEKCARQTFSAYSLNL